MVRTILRGQFDFEDIASKIWIELYENKKELSWLYVRNRCIDELRKDRTQFVSNEILDERQKEATSKVSSLDLLNKIFEGSFLNPEEKHIIYKRFYKDVPIKELNEHQLIQALDKLKCTLELFKTELLGE
jgi:DNA-directed RNA polymerase specialized sigma24 family protein